MPTNPMPQNTIIPSCESNVTCRSVNMVSKHLVVSETLFHVRHFYHVVSHFHEVPITIQFAGFYFLCLIMKTSQITRVRLKEFFVVFEVCFNERHGLDKERFLVISKFLKRFVPPTINFIFALLVNFFWCIPPNCIIYGVAFHVAIPYHAITLWNG